MKVTKISSWADFESEVAALFDKIKSKRNQSEMYVSDPLFRGHRDASWTLQTTLERYANYEYTVADYYRILLAVRPAITSLTERSWELGKYEFEEEERPGPPPGYEFMIYVRHHGLPSPLLDWTHSPYVAAFFAFRLTQHSEADEAAIYSYTEYYAAGKTYSPNLPTIIGLGPYVVTHRRHYNQQCAYTICIKDSKKGYVYCPHEEAIRGNDRNHDMLTKYVLPTSERDKVLEILDRVNINAYSLFGGEDALMETLAYREIERRGHR